MILILFDFHVTGSPHVLFFVYFEGAKFIRVQTSSQYIYCVLVSHHFIQADATLFGFDFCYCMIAVLYNLKRFR